MGDVGGVHPAHGKARAKTDKLGAVNGSLKAGRGLILTVTLPAAAVSALGNGAKESATFTVAVAGPAGAARATTKVAMLRAIR